MARNINTKYYKPIDAEKRNLKTQRWARWSKMNEDDSAVAVYYTWRL